MKKYPSQSARWPVLASLLAMVAATYNIAGQPAFGPNDPYRPYDQKIVVPAESGGPHEGLYLNTDLGISFVQDTAILKNDPGVRFSIGPGYTLYGSPRYEIGAQFETGLIYNSTDQVQTSLNSRRRVSADLFQVPFLVDLVYALHFKPGLVPYFGVGGGAVYRDLNSTSLGSSSSTDAAFQAMAGLRFRLGETHELGLGYKFLATFPSGSDILNHTVSAAWVLHF